MTRNDALDAVRAALATHDAGAICFFTMPGVPDAHLVVEVCSDADGEASFLELPADDWADVYQALRGGDATVVVNAEGAVRTW